MRVMIASRSRFLHTPLLTGALAALAAALCWTAASSLWRGLATSLSASQLNLLKNLLALALLAPGLLLLPWPSAGSRSLGLLIDRCRHVLGLRGWLARPRGVACGEQGQQQPVAGGHGGIRDLPGRLWGLLLLLRTLLLVNQHNGLRPPFHRHGLRHQHQQRLQWRVKSHR